MMAALSVFSGFLTAKRDALRGFRTASNRLQSSLFCARDGRETLALRLLLEGLTSLWTEDRSRADVDGAAAMDSGTVGSVVFVGATVLFLAAPSAEGEAKAGPGVIRADEVVAPLPAIAAKVEEL